MAKSETSSTGKPAPQSRLGIKSVEVAAAILDALSETPGFLPLKDIAASAGMHPGKVHRYLVSLTRSGLVEQDSASGRYGIGPLALKVGLAALGNIDVVRYASEELPGLRDGIDETVVLAVWGNLGPTIVWIEESGQAVRVNLRIGHVLPVMETAIGRAFAAFLPAKSIKQVVARQRGRVEGAGSSVKIGSSEATEILDKIRAKGLARIDGTLVPGVAALAAPIRNFQGAVAAVVASIGRKEEFDLRWSGPNARALKSMAAKVSRRLGHTG